MKFKLSMILTMAVVLLATLALSGCTSPSPAVSPTAAPTATVTPKPVALSVKGMVDNPLQLTLQDLAAYPNVTITTTGKNNTTVTATGVSLNKLLDDAKPKANATNVTFTAADGYNKTVSLLVVRNTTDAIVSYENNSSLRDILPGQATGTWVGKAGASLTTIELS